MSIKVGENTFFIIYKVLLKIKWQLGIIIRLYFYRRSVLKIPNLFLLKNSELGFLRAEKSIRSGRNLEYKNEKKRLGIIGSLSNSQLFSSTFWDNFPETGIDLFLYEFLPNGFSSNLSLKKFKYRVFRATYFSKVFDKVFKDGFDYNLVSKSINDDKIDFLFVSIETLGKFTYGKLFNLINQSTKIMVMNPGSFPYFHPKISIQSQGQLYPLWKVVDSKLYFHDGRKIDDYKFVDDVFSYDKRDLKIDYQVREKHNNFIFVHGNLRKLLNPEFLDIVSKILKNDRDRKFVFMGFESPKNLKKIKMFFKKNKLSSQVEYLGNFRQKKDENGMINDPNWKLCKKLLKKSAVFLNPFPMGAGSSRMEAFASGIPVIDLIVDDNNLKETYKNRDYVYRKIDKKQGSSCSKKEYYELAEEVFKNKKLRKNIIHEQYKIVSEYMDEKVFWHKILMNSNLINYSKN